jgi:glyoxylase-like metal-dependent hydrolase (beta-lactamase superfamily II)
VKLFFHFSVAGFSNTYVVGPDNGGDAIIIDPGAMNVALLNLIESNHFYARYVLVTHGHPSHVSGLKTLRKIYDFDIYADSDTVLDFDCKRVTGGQTFTCGEYEVSAYSLRGHSGDSLAYGVGNCLFTGDALCAGSIGKTASGFARELLINEIAEHLLSLDGDRLIFPGHGAPSTLNAERLLNPLFAGSR